MVNPPPVPVPPLPAVAVVDAGLVSRRRQVARPARIAGAWCAGGAVGVMLGTSLSWLPELVVIALAVAGTAVVVWAVAWTGPRPGTGWVLGVEPDGVRIAHGLAVGGQVFLPWAVVGAARAGRVLATPVLRICLLPPGREWLRGRCDPDVADRIARRGFTLYLHGTSMSARAAADLMARVRAAHTARSAAFSATR